MPSPLNPVRCARHGLAIGADGLCALCRRRPAPTSGLRNAVAAVALLGVAGGAAALLVTRRPAERASVAEAAPAPADVPAAQPVDEAAAELEARRELAVEQHERLIAEERRREDAERTTQLRAQAAAEERRRLRDAMDDVSITLYTTTWCPVCAEARGFLSSNGIRFADHDVEGDPAAAAALRRLNPRRSVPTIDIDGQVLVGFAPRSITGALERAARRRLAAAGD